MQKRTANAKVTSLIEEKRSMDQKMNGVEQNMKMRVQLLREELQAQFQREWSKVVMDCKKDLQVFQELKKKEFNKLIALQQQQKVLLNQKQLERDQLVSDYGLLRKQYSIQQQALMKAQEKVRELQEQLKGRKNMDEDAQDNRGTKHQKRGSGRKCNQEEEGSDQSLRLLHQQHGKELKKMDEQCKNRITDIVNKFQNQFQKHQMRVHTAQQKTQSMQDEWRMVDSRINSFFSSVRIQYQTVIEKLRAQLQQKNQQIQLRQSILQKKIKQVSKAQDK